LSSELAQRVGAALAVARALAKVAASARPTALAFALRGQAREMREIHAIATILRNRVQS